MISGALQKALLAKLKGSVTLMNIVTNIYDVVPQEATEESPNDELFPYIAIGDEDDADWSTDTENGFDTDFIIHVWTRYDGRKQARAIQKIIYDLLHNQTLTVTGYNALTPSFVSGSCFPDVDDLTQHGVQTFQILADKT